LSLKTKKGLENKTKGKQENYEILVIMKEIKKKEGLLDYDRRA
jgi:hypothetical protein